ncbi:site-specific integrase [Vibrio parahaemolyticus]|uniref:hypothetical protein n=1 Tax=Vibrio parahaemolyticus TaxID=670 RepID=UPI001DB2D548|nr:hypothetical protein [Vibrio parahaemolyticus]EGQ8300667.1 hypothetical protein [Vibrio parahaemolyticus]EGR1599049.1 site-specific integrase [Vibrio parahaemolyticus]EGR1762828.1 site-specific integrase [Vibrio parahaemolyticus]EGR3145961.1 site-specific integrase [Vibrio parahaemolyticus]EGR3163954.1 site-specific integrase [Vibrio parahaemolyticus]
MPHSVKKVHRTDDGAIFTPEQIGFIKSMTLPSVMEITQASEFDTPYVQIKSDRWEYIRLGRTHVEEFNLDEHSNKLLKWLSTMHTESHMAPLGSVRFYALKKLLRESDSVSFSVFKQRLEVLSKTTNSMDYYLLKSVTHTLIRHGFPSFDIDDEETLQRVATPKVTDPFLRYQEVEDTMPTHFKNLIANRLVEFGTEEGLRSLAAQDLKNLCVLGLAFAMGPRPQQFAMLKGCSVKLIAANHKTALKLYEVAVPLAKQNTTPMGGPKITLSQEIGVLLDEYKHRFDIGDNCALFPYNGDVVNTSSREIHKALNDALLFIQPDGVKDKIRLQTMHRPRYSVYDFRHNIGHSMAMAGASAEEIAMVLGHTTTVAAQYYIMSTPELALLKHKALGQNPVWKDMMGLLLTGYLTDESEWSGKTVSGMLKGKLLHRIGGCNRLQDKCHLAQVRSCYGCFYFRPFKNLNEHETVLEVITHELFELVKTSHDAGQRNNPLIDAATQTKNEVEMVINRLKGGLR